SWKILCWNIRGLNSDKKWNSLRDKISEPGCDIICLQKTKKDSFDLQFIRNFCPAAFDAFEYLPSIGASEGTLAFANEFSISVEFISKHNDLQWILTNVYGPCTSFGKQNFTNWLQNIQMPEAFPWLLLGDFN
ncbi:hypothetical protein PVAP13_3NG170326, partial [Panicum virgatum]